MLTTQDIKIIRCIQAQIDNERDRIRIEKGGGDTGEIREYS